MGSILTPKLVSVISHLTRFLLDNEIPLVNIGASTSGLIESPHRPPAIRRGFLGLGLPVLDRFFSIETDLQTTRERRDGPILFIAL